MEMIFTGRTAVITGGANGIGRCVLEGFIERGAKVSAIDIDRDSLTSLGRVHGADHIFFHGDAGRREDLEDFAGKVKEKFGKVDFLINNASISRRGIISN
ncbi:MAG TPA: short-chain dehydrogenase, partial [Phycisphaerales bacterium]|nr:short-chain dehydrogenase [Phycisphaerales bacterium]